MRPALPAVLLALCCVLAGCNAFAPGTNGPADPPTVTPADVPDTASGELAPGLTQDRLTNASALLAAHRSLLADESVVVERRTRATAANGTRLYEQRIEYQYPADRSFANGFAGGLQTGYDSVDIWANETTTLYRYGGEDEPRYRTRDRGMSATPSERLRYDLGTAGDDASRPVETRFLGETAGTERYLVTLETPQSEPPRSYVVDETGFVHRVQETFTASLSHEGRTYRNATIETRTRYRVSNESLDPADWVADAREAIANREYIAPGVTAEGVTSARTLRNAHRNVTANASVTYVSERREVAGDGTVQTVEAQTVRRSPDPPRYYERERSVRNGETYREARWMNATGTYVRHVDGNRTDYQWFENGLASEGAAPRSVPTPRLSGSLELRQTDITRLDDGRYRLVVEDYGATVRYGDVDGTVRDRSLVVVFDERGFVSRYTQRYTVEYSDGTTTTTVDESRYSDLGETSVDRPDWLPTAVNETRETDGDDLETEHTTTVVE
ncbi:hypothetical protein ACFPYI_08075 [Halomarina salina]|uniref:Outer membrane lipoprotein-sorting protein n=1 Tax=Halomarina salina TaxID=1872699 RepID=A0ABD5RLQ2_9EURY|nr:hypothetical protein [Halomarina salina]